MRIVVCVKYVPELEDRAFSGQHVDRSVDGVLNEVDENAVEAALQITQAQGGTVTALTLGPEDADDALRRALAMGADDAIHICDDRAAGSDAFATARILSAALSRLGAEQPIDLILTGMASLDGLTGMVPAALASLLDLPSLTLASELQVSDGVARIRRASGGRTQVLEADLPALVSITDDANEPRYPAFKGIMAAKKTQIPLWTLDELEVNAQEVGQAGSRYRVVDASVRPDRPQGIMIDDGGQAAAELADFLISQKLV